MEVDSRATHITKDRLLRGASFLFNILFCIGLSPIQNKTKIQIQNKTKIQKTKIMASGPITSWHVDGETVETVSDFIFWAPKSLQMVIAAMKLKDAYSLEGKL